MRTSLVLGCLSLLLGAHAAADELRVADIRLSYGYVPDSGEHMSGRFEDRSSDGSINRSGTLDAIGVDSERHRFALGYYHSLRALEAGRGSLLLGLDAVNDREDEGSMTQDTLLGQLFIGWVWPLSPEWHIEQGVVLGAGRQRQNLILPDGFFGGEEFSDTWTGFVYEYGMRIGVRWTTRIGLQVGLDVNYLVMQSKPEFEDEQDLGGGVTERITYNPTHRQQGIAVGLCIGYRL
ncbi:MAG TPA: hypothetical protein VEL07_08080 [Planctomycetota bacterium]|nr:hypothetical protein [Planctomycetota bacterium]